MDSGVARRPIFDHAEYLNGLRARLDPTAGLLQLIFDEVRANPKRVIFAEGEEEKVIRAALAFRSEGYGEPVLIGREQQVRDKMAEMGLHGREFEIHNARESTKREQYYEFLYHRLQRRGVLYRDVVRQVNQDRNVFAACMVALGDGDAMVTGLTRRFTVCYDDVRRVIDAEQGRRVFGLSMIVARGRTVFVADTSVHELPTPVELADIAEQSAAVARRLGHDPRVALLSFSTFGNPMLTASIRIRDAVSLLDSRELDFEYDGEMSADVALNPDLMALYPFCRLSGPANVLVMPALHSANIASKLLQTLGNCSVIGPLLVGLAHPVQVVSIGSTVSDLVNVAALAAHDAGRRATR